MGQQSSKQEECPKGELLMFGYPNILLVYKTIDDEFTIKNLPQGFQVMKNMGGVQISKDSIYISGGINAEFNKISQQLYHYNSITNTFKELPSMAIARYTHVLQYNSHTSYLYALGGRTYGSGEKGILEQCEKFNILHKKWEPMADMNVKRATFFTIIHLSKLYVFGGYTGIRKRSRKIEFYDDINNKWNLLNFKLSYGVEQGILFQDQNKIYILGGQSKEGPTKKCQLINFSNNMVETCKFEILQKRVLQKGFQVNNYIFQLFGDADENEQLNKSQNQQINLACTLEKGTMQKLVKIELLNNPVLQALPIDCDYKEFCCVTQPIDTGKHLQQQINNTPDFLIISEKEIHKIQLNPFSTKVYQLKQNFTFYQFMGADKLDDGSYILVGGVNSQMNYISNHVYKVICNENKFLISELSPLQIARYAFGIIRTKDLIYVIGGRSYGGDDQGIMGCCEVFDMQTMKWRFISEINEKRCSPLMFKHYDTIFIAGGYTRYQTRLDSIETYDIQQDQWYLIGISLINPLEASCLYYSYDLEQVDFIIFGGRSYNDTDQVSRYSIDIHKSFDIQNNTQNLKCLPFKGSLLHKIHITDQLLLLLYGKGNEIKYCTYDIQNYKIIENNQIAKNILTYLQANVKQFFNLGRLIIIQ